MMLPHPTGDCWGVSYRITPAAEIHRRLYWVACYPCQPLYEPAFGLIFIGGLEAEQASATMRVLALFGTSSSSLYHTPNMPPKPQVIRKNWNRLINSFG